MADIYTASSRMQHFSSTGTNTVIFNRAIVSLIITVSGTVSFSSNGTDFVTITAGTHQFNNLFMEKIYFQGGGTYQGFGIST